MPLRLTKSFSFEMAHALPAYPGKCRNIHGHSYKLSVTVQSDLPLSDDGLVLDFHQLKTIVQHTIVDRFDHALLLPADSPFSVHGSDNVIYTPFPPTTEHLLLHFQSLLSDKFPPEVRLYSIRLSETDTSSAELLCE